MKNEIIIFENQNVKLEVNMKDETVWLNRNQIAKLFERNIKTIGKHINNALAEELDNSVVAKFATTASDGKSYNMDYYNLDMIISIGYCVKSKNGIVFRKWGSSILKGYATNQKRLEYLEKTVQLIDIANRINDNIDNQDAVEVLRVIGNYSKALDLLDDYDHRRMMRPFGTRLDGGVTYGECIGVINCLRFTEESDLFALERNRGLESIINNIYKTYDECDVYETIEEKASNFLYMIVKNHVFIDGNKRITATLFIFYSFIIFCI